MPDIVLRVVHAHRRQSSILPYEDNASGKDPEAEFEKGQKMLDESIKVAEKLKKLQGQYKGDAKQALVKVIKELEGLLDLIGDNKVLAIWVRMLRPLVPKLKATTPEKALGSAEAVVEVFHWLLDMQRKAARYLNRRHADPDNELYEKVNGTLNGALGKAFKELKKPQMEFSKEADKLSYDLLDALRYAEVLPPLETSPDNMLIEDYNSLHSENMSYASNILLHYDLLEETFNHVVVNLKEMKGYLKDMEKNYKARVYK